ncbi:MAG TPA: hypothetical protein VFA26_23435, partial [Gemmataceae bacterium]|nr:hypothetical protein [Gemmataceae bacterium]
LAALLTGLTAPTAGATSAPAGGLSVLPDGDPLPPAALASGEAFAVLLAPAPGGVGEALTRSAGSVAPAGPACDACFADTGWLEDALAALG